MKKYYRGEKINKAKDKIKKEKQELINWDKLSSLYIKLYDAMLEEDKKKGESK